jgi:hypothetical protein
MTSEIQITPSEREAQALSPERLSDVFKLMDEYGYLILRGVIETSHLNQLQSLYDDAWQAFKSAKSSWIAGGQIIGHLNVNPPVSKHFANAHVLGNKIVCAITSGILGVDLCISDVGGNTNQPGSIDQYLHSDVDYKEFKKLLVNIPLGDVDEENGSIEIVPKSHKSNIQFPEPADVAASFGPIRVNSQMGDALIRSPHVWHRGRANPSTQPRHMLSAWHEAIPEQNRAINKLMIDPTAPNLFIAYTAHFRELGTLNTAPKFRPNYFSPNLSGLLNETFYRHPPQTYLSMIRTLKKFK